MGICRHSRPECGCLNPNPQPLSSGRWDAAGSWQEAVLAEMDKSLVWAKSLTVSQLSQHVATMASDVNAFSLYERKALLEVVAKHLEKELY